MDDLAELLPAFELLPLRLRALYESRGYVKYRVGKFEPYDIYMQNKHFLKSDGIITFTDMSGRLMALKPDVTLGIVKNADPGGASQKLYYNENVFRIEHSGEEYREINQMGVEYIGADTDYAEAEVVSLAADSLDLIRGDNMLCVSHMGFVSALLAELGVESENTDGLLKALRRKSVSQMEQTAEELGITGAGLSSLISITELSGNGRGVLSEAKRLCLCTEMEDSVTEMEHLFKTLAATGRDKRIKLDFSVVNDLDYYNGIVFRGYIRCAPRAVLAGGRYDNLLRRFGKPQSALGFALYLSELDRILRESRGCDVDVLLVYGDAEPNEVARAVESLVSRGVRVRAEKTVLPEVRANKIIPLSEVTRYA